ncbi:MAG: RNA 2',3'-cyclic phosphodiesterase, partial [Nitrospinota bacterium]
IAAPLSPAWHRRIEQLQETLKGYRVLSGFRWVKAQGIHLTLKFLGNIPSEAVEEIAMRIEPLATKRAPFSLRLTRLGIFPTLRRPRILWLGPPEPVPELNAFQGEVEDAVEELGFAREKRSFKVHLTIGRARGELLSGGGPVKLVEALRAGEESLLSCEEGGNLTLEVARVIIYKSVLRPEGASYYPLVELPLKGAPGAFPEGEDR